MYNMHVCAKILQEKKVYEKKRLIFYRVCMQKWWKIATFTANEGSISNKVCMCKISAKNIKFYGNGASFYVCAKMMEKQKGLWKIVQQT